MILESLPETDPEKEAGDVGAILRLHGAGRRYLIEERSSISKGVRVLSRVNNDINCVCVLASVGESKTVRQKSSAVEIVSSGMLAKAAAARRIQLLVVVVKSESEPVYIHNSRESHRKLAT
jgi:hypothetical protein